MRGERMRLHIDPYYCQPQNDGYDPSSPRSSSPSPSFSFSPPTDMSSNASRTPLSASPQWRLCYVLCLYDFASSDPDHLPFRKNEILEIVEKEESGWWAALRDDCVGWVPSSFLAELSHEVAERLMSVQEELRIYEYEAEKLFIVETSRCSFESGMPPISTCGAYGYGAIDDDNWVPILEPGGKGSFLHSRSHSVHVVTDFPDDVAPLSSISPPRSDPQFDTYSIEGDSDATLVNNSLVPTKGRTSSPDTPMPRLNRPDISALQVNKPIPPTPPLPLCPSPSCASPRSPLNRSRSDSSPLHARQSRRRPILVNDFKSLSRLSDFIDSPCPDSAAPAADELQFGFFDDARPPSTPRRSDKVRQLTGDEDAQAFHNAKVAQANLPWYLQPSYGPDDIKLDYDGSIRAGTLPALIERLTADPLKMTEEKLYRDVCLTTFSTFTSASELFQLLIERFEMEYPASLTREEANEWREKKLRPVQKRVLTILTMWVENHGMLQDDPHVVPRLKEFLSMIKAPPSLALSAKLILQSIDKLTTQSVQATLPPPLPLTPSTKSKHSRASKNELTRFSAGDLAAQLMLYEHRLYVKIRPRECLLWAKSQTGEGVANLSAFSATHDRIAAWVKNSVLANDGLGKRADAIDYWIKVAEKCRAINNFSSMTAIIAALSSAVISRLYLTWAHTGRSHHFENLSKLNEPTGNFSAFRAAMQAIEGPCVPFIGIYLTDIVHIQDQMKDNVQFPLSPKTQWTLRSTSPILATENERTYQHNTTTVPNGKYTCSGSPSSSISSPRSITSFSTCQTQSSSTSYSSNGPAPLGPPLINFVKRQKWYDAVRAILRFQSKPLNGNGNINISENPAIMGFINEQLAIANAKSRDDSYFWTRGQELLMNEVSQADIRRGLEAAGF
ncbi:hypothetical protein ACEPAG_212 [Sanghuangporus baumii]